TRVKHIHFKLFATGSQPLTTEIELLPDDDGRILVKVRLEGDGDVLDATGTVSMECDPPAIRFRPVADLGNPPTKGWIYDYVGTLTYRWPDADGQRPAIVGTVIRTVPHATNRSPHISRYQGHAQSPPGGCDDNGLTLISTHPAHRNPCLQ